MRFWDSSGLVPLIIEEPKSQSCRRLLRADPRMLVWALAETEVLSALCRRHRAVKGDPEDLRRAEARLERLAARWTEVDALLLVREQAARLLHIHDLRAADALQLAAALHAADLRPRRLPFVSLDAALIDAARREGFEVIRPEGSDAG